MEVAVDDLIAFLKARLDEDEQAARKAASLCGCHPDAPSWIFGDEETDGRVLVADDPHSQVKRKLGRRWSSTYDGLFMAQHIVRHDPARVLREVEAKRRLLDEHKQGRYGECVTCDVGAQSCGCCGWGDFPCSTVRLLALPYADHPDCRKEWLDA